jgi:hypothetical protein
MFGFFLAPLVVVQRLPLILKETMSTNPLDRTESVRMVAEKVAAAQEAVVAAHWAAAQAPLQMSLAMMRGASPAQAAMTASRKIWRAASKPAERRVRANMRRLRKKA